MSAAAAGADPADPMVFRACLRDREVCVAGLGVSGPSIVRALLSRGARVTAVDARTDDATQRGAAALRTEGARVELGGDSLPPGTGLVVTSPGWRPDSPLLVAAARSGIEVIGDVELAWRLRPAGQTWLGVTGTNGKTTTVRMLEAMLRADGRDAVAVGNVGTPVVEAALPDTNGAHPELLAVELSSFQLHWSASLRPRAAVVLNVAPDHLDWHGGLEPYARAKGRIHAPGTIRVANTEDAWSLRLARECGDPEAPLVGFSTGAPRAGELGVESGLLVDRAFDSGAEGGRVELAHEDDVVPAAPHNVSNALAAAALARSVGAEPASVRAGVVAFDPEPHRISHVATVGGVRYVDDSKATNPHAAAASVASYPSIVWIAGGLLKGAEVDDLVRVAAGRLRGAVLLGRDRARLRAALAEHARGVPIVDVDTSANAVADTHTGTGSAPRATGAAAMDEAVARAAELARPGDTVLLAPAAASMDMFTDYNERGDEFARAVRARSA